MHPLKFKEKKGKFTPSGPRSSKLLSLSPEVWENKKSESSYASALNNNRGGGGGKSERGVNGGDVEI